MENTYIVLPYLTRLGELARKLSFLPTELDVFLYMVLSSLFLTPTTMNLAVYGNGLAVLITLTASIKRDVYPLRMHSCSKNIRSIYHFLF